MFTPFMHQMAFDCESKMTTKLDQFDAIIKCLINYHARCKIVFKGSQLGAFSP